MRPDDLDEFRAAQADEDRHAALDRALRQLEREKVTKAEMVAAVYGAARDAAATIRIPPVTLPKMGKTKQGKPETAICLLADWQLGKLTPEYDSDIAAVRIKRYVAKVASIIRIQRAPILEARVYLLGDLLEGELIFPGQAHRIDASLYRQVFGCAQILADLVRALSAVVAKVRVVGVIGNHGALGGRGRREYHPESNADAMAYNVARMLTGENARIEWPETLTAGERAWYAQDAVQGKTWFLFHGDQVKSASFGVPWYGFNKRLLGWYTSVGAFDYSASGHWHQSVRFPVNAITHWGAGSTESGNTFAQEYLASGGQAPSQWLLFQGEDGVTAEYEVRCDR